MDTNDTGTITNASIKIHKELGLALFESVYLEMLRYELRETGSDVKNQVAIPVYYDNLKMEIGFRSDLIAEKKIIAEIKSLETIAAVHKKAGISLFEIE